MRNFFNFGKGAFIYYIRVFGGFLEPPTLLCKDIFITESKEKLPFAHFHAP